MDGMAVLKKFGFRAQEEPESIYPFSPVYRVTGEKEGFIVKKTQRPIERAQRMMRYTNNLKEYGIDVVTPVNLNEENPQSIGGDVYVVYPFINGAQYSGKEEEIIAAGRLLGKIHNLSPKENTFELEEYDVYDFNKDEVIESVKNIEENAAQYNFRLDGIQLKEKLLEIVTQQEELKNSGLPYVITPHDFKANNLIYTPGPYLIDPDNASWIPRIFDLALALLLFHNELSTAPDTPFTPNQWKLFLDGYKESVKMMEAEQVYWQKAVEHVFLDEVMWLMADAKEDWANPSQRNIFEGLIKIFIDTSSYSLK